MPQMPSYLINSSMCCNIHPVQFRLKSSVLSKKHHSPHWLFPPRLPFFSFLRVWTHGPCFLKREPSAPSTWSLFAASPLKNSYFCKMPAVCSRCPFLLENIPQVCASAPFWLWTSAAPSTACDPFPLWPGPSPTTLGQRFADRRPSESAVSLHVIWPSSFPDTGDPSPLGFQGTVLLVCLPRSFPTSMDHSKGTDCWWSGHSHQPKYILFFSFIF